MNTLLGLLGTLGVSLASASPGLSRAQVIPSDDGTHTLFNVGELIPNTATFHPYLNESNDHDTIFFGFRLQTKYAVTLDFGYMWESPDGSISGSRLTSGEYRNCLYFRVLYSPQADFKVGNDFYKLSRIGINGRASAQYDVAQHTSYANDIFLWPWASQSDSALDFTGVGPNDALVLPTNAYHNYFTWLTFDDRIADGIYLTSEEVACLDALIQSEGVDSINYLVTLDYGSTTYQALTPLFNGVKFDCLPILSCIELITTRDDVDISGELQSAYDTGYSDGFTAGSQSNVGKVEVVNFYDVFSMIVSLPVSFLTKAFDMELYRGTPYAFNPAVFVVSILSILMIWRIVVMVIGLKK